VKNSPHVPAGQPTTDVARQRGLPDRDPKSEAGPSRSAARRWVTAIALGLWFVLVPLGCGEVVLRMASRAGILLFDVEMWRYAREVKRPSDRPGVVLEHRPNVEGTMMGVRYRTDGHGFRRAAPDLEALRTGSERVVAVVGDSCTLGWGVPEGFTMSEQLERTLNASQPATDRRVVLNASVGNSNTSMEYARYVQDVRPLHPIWVILGFFVNDAEPDPTAMPSPLFQHSALLAMLSTRVPSLLSPARQDYRSYYEGLYTPQSDGLEHFQRAVRAFGAALRADGVAATMLLIPEMHEPRHFGPFADLYRRVAELAAESGFEVIDPSEAFPAGSGERYWVTKGDSHPNAKAHALFAEALARSPAARQLAGS
jgi:lysophospholipase L1-like esterase